jgi:hypothetical protein
LRRTSVVRTFALQLLPLTLATASASAQDDRPSRLDHQIVTAGINAAVGGLTAGTWRILSGKSFWNGFLRGAGAGVAVFAGKRIIAEGSPAAWWAGRQLAAIGGSEVANAAEGRAPFQKITIPAGPVRLHFEPRAKLAPSASLDLASTVAAIVVGTRSGNRLGIQESLATGTIAFVTPELSDAIGGNVANIITISELAPDGDFPPLENKRDILSHELIHSAQYDFVLAAWGDAAQTAILRKLHLSGGITRYIDFSLLLPFQIAANELISYDKRPWEREAHLLVPNGN